MEPGNPFVLLGVDYDASERDITKAYRQLALRLHPDKNPNDPDAGARFALIVEAHETLMDPISREKFAAEIRAQRERKRKFEEMDARRREMRERLEKQEAQEMQGRKEKELKERLKRRVEEELDRFRLEIIEEKKELERRRVEKNVVTRAKLEYNWLEEEDLEDESIETLIKTGQVPPLPSEDFEVYENRVLTLLRSCKQ